MREAPGAIRRHFATLLRFSRSTHYHLERSFVLRNHVCRQNTAPVAAWVNNAVASDDAAGVQHGIAADFGEIAQQRAELAQTSVKRLAIDFHSDVSGERFEIREDHTRADVGFMAKD